MAEDRFYTVAQVAAKAHISEASVRSLSSRGRMPKGQLEPAPHGGRRLVFPAADIDRWVRIRPTVGRPAKRTATRQP